MARVDLAVIGGGTAGLVAAIGAAGQGARVVLIEQARTGGDCLWSGCVPSKALIEAASAAHVARSSQHLGVSTPRVEIDLGAVMQHVKDAIGVLEPHDSPQRLRSLGIEVVHGHATLVAPDALEVDGHRIPFRRALIATGSAPVVPDLPGFDAVEPLTNESVWDLTELPERLVVLGGGAIGCELGQAFARLGSQVTIVEMADRLLVKEEPDASELIAHHLREEGLEVHLGTRALRAEVDGDGSRHLVVDAGAGEQRLAFDRLLVAVGRAPRTAGLGLEAAEVALDRRGAVMVDERLRTSNPRIFAAGDVTLALPFTHVASTHGATVVQNALFGLRAKVDHERIPWVTFTSPEVARVGLTADEARTRFGQRAVVRDSDHITLDRAVTADATGGFARLVGDHKGRLVGATVVGPRAGETIGEIVAWMAGDAKLAAIARSSTHAYPTWSEDVAAASLAQLQADLARLRPLSRLLLLARRLLTR